ncbi:phosphonate metabolism transcriptional regulator PhnF [Microvirga sp. VF16]|uniref:phosphonate metabolism transcriptional regulator PhnF n=1 Tax=Microvirga sp. VF16 TaxID=2807101 RepID=UPI00193EB571|nr:phosphonate metabolism transcriptional regulator PhnF [Microvirga sp. VF16]QRM32396.1 phosphonate metabolism transcriptional regulator PhnF [Microvirga sp. VF16]
MANAGVTLWRQISEALASEIEEEVLMPGDRLPSSAELGTRFGVNRLTVLKAISHLQSEGLVRTERGGGIYVEKIIPYRMGARTRFEENLLEQNRSPSREILSVEQRRASKRIASALQIKTGDPVVLVVLVTAADGLPVSYNQNFFPQSRLPEIYDSFHRLSGTSRTDISTRAILASHGVSDFRRRSIRIRGRTPTPSEVAHLRMAPSETVFEVEVNNVDAQNVPVVHGITAFCSTRVEFVMELDE